MPPRVVPFRLTPSIVRIRQPRIQWHSTKKLIPPPKRNSGPLLEYRDDRELPEPESAWGWARTLPIFIVVMLGSTLAIFNYQKSSSSVVSSTIFALRTSDEARRLLGDEIYFKHRIPWIWGTIDQLHGNIDISFTVKGTKSWGNMKFKSERKQRMGFVGFYR
jgi:cytochrome c oxidase assembly factor 1